MPSRSKRYSRVVTSSAISALFEIAPARGRERRRQDLLGRLAEQALGRLPIAAAATSLACTTANVRASSRAIASGAASITRRSDACALDIAASAWRRRSMSSSANVSCPRPVAGSPVATALPTTQNSRPSRARTRHSNVSACPSTSCVEAVRATKRMLAARRGRHGGDRLADEVGQLAGEHAPRRAVHPFDAARADGDDADQHRVEDRARALGHQLALERERLELDLLRLQAGDVGEHRDRLVEAGRAAGAPHRQRIPGTPLRAPPLPSSRSPLEEPASTPLKANSVS